MQLGRHAGLKHAWLADIPSLANFLVLSLFLIALYASVLGRLVAQWWEDPNYGHGFLVPVFAGYVLWHERSRWRSVEPRPTNLGLAVVLTAVAMLIAGTLAAELFVTRSSLLVLLAGIVLFLAGWKALRAVVFPLGYVIFMIPLPAILYNQIAFPLQLEASRFASACLELLRVPVLREGNLLYLPNYTLEVVEACSGIRSMMSLVALSVAYGYLAGSSRWVRVALVALVIPIAVLTNALRVVLTGVLAYKFGPALAEGFFHLFSGWLIFVTAITLMLPARWLLDRVDRRIRKDANG